MRKVGRKPKRKTKIGLMKGKRWSKKKGTGRMVSKGLDGSYYTSPFVKREVRKNSVKKKPKRVMKTAPNVVINKKHFLNDGLLKHVTCKNCVIGGITFVKETEKNGLYEKLLFRCDSCEDTFVVETSAKIRIPREFYEKAKIEKRSYKVPAINVQSSSGEIFTGGIREQINAYLASLGLSHINDSAKRNMSKKVGECFVQYCKDREDYWLERETELTMTLNEKTGEKNKLFVTFDGSWTKRGSGRSYNSSAGWVLGMGKLTRKIICHRLYCKSCAFCSHYEKREKEIPYHKCWKNFEGSSKSMETRGTIDIIQWLNKNTPLGCDRYGMDGDSTVDAQLKQLGIPCQKSEDKNHFRKYMMGWLRRLKEKKYKNQQGVLGENQRERFFIYVQLILKKYKVDGKDVMIQKLRNLVDHCFNSHDNCDGEWCKYVGLTKDEAIEKGKDEGFFLRWDGKQLKKDISEIVEKLVRHIDNITDLCSTNPNEAANGVIHQKTKKITDNSRSGDLTFKVSSAITVFNDGPSFFPEVQKRMGVPPSMINTHYFPMEQSKRSRHQSLRKTIKAKRQRNDRKSAKKMEQRKYDKTKRIHYSKGIAFEAGGQVVDRMDFDLEDGEQFHYGLPKRLEKQNDFLTESDDELNSMESEVDREDRKRKREEIDVEDVLQKYQPTKKKLRKKVHHIVLDNEYLSGKDKHLLQIGLCNLETGKAEDILFDPHESGKKFTPTDRTFVNAVNKSEGIFQSNEEGLKEFLSKMMKKKGKVFLYAFNGKGADYKSLQNAINRVDDDDVKKKLQRKYDKLIKIDVYSLIGRHSVDDLLSTFFDYDISSEKFPDGFVERLPKWIANLPRHNGKWDAYVEGLILLQIFSIKQLHQITKKYFRYYGEGECEGGTKKIRKKLKVEPYEKYVKYSIQEKKYPRPRNQHLTTVSPPNNSSKQEIEGQDDDNPITVPLLPRISLPSISDVDRVEIEGPDDDNPIVQLSPEIELPLIDQFDEDVNEDFQLFKQRQKTMWD